MTLTDGSKRHFKKLRIGIWLVRLPQTFKLSTNLTWRINYIQCCVTFNQIEMRLLKRLFKKRELIPLNWKQEDCPKLEVGDTLVGITENDTWDYIAGFCRMNPKIDKGLTRIWKVKEIIGSTESVLIECGKNRTILDYLTWDDGNRVTVKDNLAWSEKKIRWFKEVWH